MKGGQADLLSRRKALMSAAAATASVVTLHGEELPSFIGAGSGVPDIAFCFVTDTHYLADKKDPDSMDPQSAMICRRLVDTLNGLVGERIPTQAGGGRVSKLAGIIHGGDLVDSADKRGGVYPRMHATEFAAFEADYGLNGTEGLLKYPVFEVYGNHDGPQGDTLVVEGIKRRNQSRDGIKNISENGLHYAWDWGSLHLINLGIVVGQTGSELQRRRYAPMESLQFLKQDLQRMGDANRPVVITQHIDLARYSIPYTIDEERFLHMEWHPQDVKSFHETIAPFHVIANFCGHTHRREIFGWNGTPKRQPFTRADMDAFNGDNSSHFHGGKQAFFYVEVSGESLVVREVVTEDGWRSHGWAEQLWAKKI
ncbi:MAG: hypothetical protein CMM01_24315 [Rhodopirellula sp.]|nr:hypothetical protein [Rhodopirellula sp.]